MRSSALLSRLKADQPNGSISYLTDYTELLSGDVDESLSADAATIFSLQMDKFDVIYNLDISRRACAVMNLLDADCKKGFALKTGRPWPIDTDGQMSYLRKIVPGVYNSNAVSSLSVMFALCGLEYRRETPKLSLSKTAQKDNSQADPVQVGLFLPHDSARPDCVWPSEMWSQLIELLAQRNVSMLIIAAGPDGATFGSNGLYDKDKLTNISDTKCVSPSSWTELRAVIDRCEVVFSSSATAVEMGLTAGKRAVLLGQDQTDLAELEIYHRRGRLLYPDKAAVSGTKAPLADIRPDETANAIMAAISQQTAQTANLGKVDRTIGAY